MLLLKLLHDIDDLCFVKLCMGYKSSLVLSSLVFKRDKYSVPGRDRNIGIPQSKYDSSVDKRNIVLDFYN